MNTRSPETMTPASQANIFWMDFVRTIVIFGVVVVHVSADVITEWGKAPLSWWWSANIYDSLARGCVPIFIMLSGALLLPKTESYGEFFKKRFNRIGIPFLTWSVVYLIWKKLFYEPNMGLQEAFARILSDKVCFHLWFLYIIIGLYLITPVLRVLVAHAKLRDLLYFLGLWFLISSLLPFAQRIVEMFAHANFEFKLPAEAAQGFIGYFVLGHALHQFSTKELFRPALFTLISCFLICAGGTYVLSARFHSFQQLFYENMSPNVVFYAAAFFIVVKYCPLFSGDCTNSGFRSAISLFSKASFGIYLVHPIFIDVLYHGRLGFVLRGDVFHPAYMIPVVALIVYILSFITVFAVQKIPYLRRSA